MRANQIGPFALWTSFTDDWLVSRQAVRLFLISAVLVLLLTPTFFGWVDTSKMALFQRLPWGVLGIVGSIGLLFLWFGMWRYWLRLDHSSVWNKRLWFIVLLFGFWWGSCLYFFFSYLPGVARRARTNPGKHA